MKKLFLSAILILPFLTFAQDKPEVKTTTTTTTVTTEVAQENSKPKTRFDFKNEIKLNAFNLMFGGLDVSYERLIDEESSFGVRALTTVDDDFADILESFSYTRIDGFYRYFFGRKPAAGFFMEGFGGYSNINYQEYEYFSSNQPNPKKTYSAFGFGFGLGAKFITRKNIVFEINSGIGRNLITNNDDRDKIIGRFGISAGYRF